MMPRQNDPETHPETATRLEHVQTPDKGVPERPVDVNVAESRDAAPAEEVLATRGYSWDIFVAVVTAVGVVLAVLALDIDAAQRVLLLLLMTSTVAATVTVFRNAHRRPPFIIAAIISGACALGFGLHATSTNTGATPPSTADTAGQRSGEQHAVPAPRVSPFSRLNAAQSESWTVEGTAYALLRTGDVRPGGWVEKGAFEGDAGVCGPRHALALESGTVWVHVCLQYITPLDAHSNTTQWIVAMHNSSGASISGLVIGMALTDGESSLTNATSCAATKIPDKSGAFCIGEPHEWPTHRAFTTLKGSVVATMHSADGSSLTGRVEQPIQMSTGYPQH